MALGHTCAHVTPPPDPSAKSKRFWRRPSRLNVWTPAPRLRVPAGLGGWVARAWVTPVPRLQVPAGAGVRRPRWRLTCLCRVPSSEPAAEPQRSLLLRRHPGGRGDRVRGQLLCVRGHDGGLGRGDVPFGHRLPGLPARQHEIQRQVGHGPGRLQRPGPGCNPGAGPPKEPVVGEGQLCERAWEVSHGSARGGGPRCGGQRACATAARQTLVGGRRPPGAPHGAAPPDGGSVPVTGARPFPGRHPARTSRAF